MQCYLQTRYIYCLQYNIYTINNTVLKRLKKIRNYLQYDIANKTILTLVKIFEGSLKILEDLHEDLSADL